MYIDNDKMDTKICVPENGYLVVSKSNLSY